MGKTTTTTKTPKNTKKKPRRSINGVESTIPLIITVSESAGMNEDPAMSTSGPTEDDSEAQQPPQSRALRKRKVNTTSLSNQEGVKRQTTEQPRERVINPIPRQNAEARSKAKKAQSKRDKKAFALQHKTIPAQEGQDNSKANMQQTGSETQVGVPPIAGIQQYFTLKRQRPEPGAQERQDSPERKRRGFFCRLSSICVECAPIYSHVTADFVEPGVQHVAASEASSNALVAFFAGPPLPVLDHG